MNIPNKLTISRIILIFVVLALANVGDKSLIGPNGFIVVSETFMMICHYLAFALAIFAGATDFLDGYIARKYHLVSDLGKLLDPLADKIFVAALFIILVENKIIPGWVAVIVLTREFLVTGLRMLAVRKNEIIAADIWGKIKTSLQMTLLGVGGLNWINILEFDHIVLKVIWQALLWGVVVSTLLSGVGYFIKHKNLYLGENA